MSRLSWYILSLVMVSFVACQASSSDLSPSEPLLLTPTATIPAPVSSPEPTPTTSTSSLMSAIGANRLPAIEMMSHVSLPAIDPFEVEGNLTIAGSTTLFPLIRHMYDRFSREGYRGVIDISSVGSDAGLKSFCETGEVDMAMASRRINQNEIAACLASGRVPVEFYVGTNAIAVAVNARNELVDNVTLDELAAIFNAERWSQINPDWPNQPIEHFTPPRNTGTFQLFIRQVMANDATSLLYDNTIERSSDLNFLAQSLALSDYGIGFFGYPFYRQNATVLNLLAVEGVEPSAYTVAQGHYPLSQPLFIYADPEIMTTKPQVGAFINFILSHIDEEVDQIGYFLGKPTILDQSKNKLLQAQGGNVIIDGSTAIYPLALALSERFIEDTRYPGLIEIDSNGSGSGFDGFCEEGTLDIVNASRRIQEDEIAACADIGRHPIPFRIATDALAIVTNIQNDIISNTTLSQLTNVFTAERWIDVNPAWPDQPISRFIPQHTSGNFNFFVDIVLEGKAGTLITAPNTERTTDDDILTQNIMNNPYAIGFVGYAFYQSRADTLKILAINGVEPSNRAVENGDYALARPLFMYSDPLIIVKKPQVAAFLNFALAHANKEVEQIGYFPASEQTARNTQANLYSALEANVDAYWEALKWDEMTERERQLWTILEWDEDQWNSEAALLTSKPQTWTELSLKEQEAAIQLGYTRNSW